MTTIALHEMQDFIARCDPDRPLEPGNPLYVDLDLGTKVRGGETSCMDELELTILMGDVMSPTCQLFSGFPGTGKTTELRRLKARLEENKTTPTTVVFIDFEDFIDKYVPLSVTDVLRVLSFVLDREATVAEGKNPDENPGYVKRLFDFLASTEVDIRNIGFASYGASLMLELRNNPSFRKRAESALTLRFQAFAREAEDTMAIAIARLRKATNAQRIVVIADGIEKLRPLQEEDRELVEASAQTVYEQNASWLRIPCDVIYTFPLWLRFRASPLGALYSREPQILPMVKTTTEDGKSFRPGLEKLAELLNRRVDVQRVFGNSETLLPLLEASGGYPRDLLRMVRELLYSAKDFPVNAMRVERIIENISETYARTVRSDDIDLLVRIGKTHELPEGNNEDVAHFGRLFERWLVLAYRNGKEWYDLHPLVRRVPAIKKRTSELAV